MDGQDVEEKIPHVALATNDLRKKAEISRFARNACNKGGPFASVYGQLAQKADIEKEKRFLVGSVNMGRDKPSTTAYMLVLDEPLTL